MKSILIIYSFLVLHYAIADECQGLFDHKNSTVTLSEEQFKEQPAFFYSLGREKINEDNDEFINGSFLYLGENHTPYKAKTCENSILTVYNSTDDRELRLHIASSHPTTIIQDPVNEFDEWQSTCNILSFPGDYILSVKDQFTNTPYDVKFHITSIQRKVLFYNSYFSNIIYSQSYVQLPNNYKLNIQSCRDYNFSITSLYIDKSRVYLDILNIKKSPEHHHKNHFNLCTLMSVEGLYKLFIKGKPIGEIKTYNNSNYQSYFDFNESKYNLEFSYHDIKPSLTFNDNKVVLVNNCAWDRNKYHLYSQQLKRRLVFFDNLSVLYQDSNASKQLPTIIKQKEMHKYHIDEAINHLEIESLLNNLKVPKEKIPNQLCKQLIFPGEYTINFSDHTTMDVYSIEFINVETRFNSMDYNLQVNYLYSLRKLNNEDNNILKYKCSDNFNHDEYINSTFYQLEQYSDFSSIDTLGKFEQHGPMKLITSVTHTVPDSWEELNVIDHESWLDNNTTKLKIRANKKCLELEQGKTYKATYINGDFTVKIGEIDLIRFNKVIGYTVFFKDKYKVNSENESTLLNYNSKHHTHKNLGLPILSLCTSNENANTFYTIKFTEIRKDGAYHSHNNELRDIQLKFDTITEINNHDIKK